MWSISVLCVVPTRVFVGAGDGGQGVITCMRGGVAGTGWRWWSFHLFAHTIDLVITSGARFSAVRGWSSQCEEVFSPDFGPAIIISHVSIVTNMSIPLQADLSSVVEKDAMSRNNIANFWINQQIYKMRGRGGGWINTVYEKAGNKRTKQMDIFTRTFILGNVTKKMK